MAREVDGVGADAAANFEDFFAAPFFKVGEGGDVGLDEIFAGFDFVKIFARANGLRGVANVAGTIVPVVADAIDLDLFEGHI